MVLFYSGGAGLPYDHFPEQILKNATVMLSYITHRNQKTNQPGARLRRLLKHRTKARAKE